MYLKWNVSWVCADEIDGKEEDNGFACIKATHSWVYARLKIKSEMRESGRALIKI